MAVSSLSILSRTFGPRCDDMYVSHGMEVLVQQCVVVVGHESVQHNVLMH